MEFIYTDKNRVEKGYLSNCSIDLEVGAYEKSDNDFEISVDFSNRDEVLTIGSLVYCVGTEYGGIIEGIESDTGNELIKLTGGCPRKFIENEIIAPKTRTSPYYVFKGEANQVIHDYFELDRSVFSYNGSTTKTISVKKTFADLFVVDNLDMSGFEIDYKARYLNAFFTFEEMLKRVDAKLDMKWQSDGKIHIQVIPIHDYSEELEINNDYGLSMIAKNNTHNFNHCIALGKGELQERVVLNVFKVETELGSTLLELSEIKDTSVLPKEWITMTYDYGSVESVDELKDKAIQKLKEIQKENTLDISFDALEVDIGDIIKGSESISGVTMYKQVTKKIVKSQQYENSSTDTIEYKLGD